MKFVKKYLHEIFYLIGEEKVKLPFIIILFIGASFFDFVGLGLIVPYIALVFNPNNLIEGNFGRIINNLGISIEPNKLIITIGILLIIIFLLKGILALFITRVILKFSWNRQIDLRTNLMNAYQNLPYVDFIQRNSSDFIQTIQVLVAQYNTALRSLLILISQGIIAIAILILLAMTNATALIILISIITVTLYIYDRIFRKNIQYYGEKSSKNSQKVLQALQEGISGLKEIRILGNANFFKKIVEDGTKKISNYQIKKELISTAPRYLIESILISFIVLFVYINLTHNGNKQELINTLAMFGLGSVRLIPLVGLFSISINDLRFSRYATSRIYEELMQIEKNKIGDIKHRLRKHNPKSLFNNISFNNISFRYPNSEQWAIDNISFNIEAGESIGIIGPSGSGKTTLVDIFLGLLTPQKGKIYYNGNTLSSNLFGWWSQIAYLPQEIFIIDSTLRKNIAIGVKSENIDNHKLNEALHKAHLSQLITELPLGVETPLGERGVRLSGGQRQRVALARAFYHERSVLVMDEATSSLDYETELEVVKEIKRLKGEKTLIVIAHRLTTIEHCDRILKLKNGRLIKEGSYKNVIANN